jgi:GNAT superfamily N-acetyltransferase
VADGPSVIRRAASEDDAFMADMLMAAVNWSPEWKKKSRNYVLSAPSTAHYIAGWPRDDDLGVIAEADGERIGAAWLRFLPAADPGYGFVAPSVPELTVGVAAHWRGRGAGRTLLRAIAGQTRSAGIQQISLSVERKNFGRNCACPRASGSWTLVTAPTRWSRTLPQARSSKSASPAMGSLAEAHALVVHRDI